MGRATAHHDHRLISSEDVNGTDVIGANEEVIGEIDQTAPAYVGIGAALVHADIGTGYDEKDAVTLTWLPQIVAGMLAPGGIAVSGLPLQEASLNPLPVPQSVPQDRYFLYRKI